MADEIYRTLGRLIAERRKRVPMTQHSLAKALQISRATVANIERGAQAVQLHTIFRIAEILNVSVLELIPMKASTDQSHPIQVAEWLNRVLAQQHGQRRPTTAAVVQILAPGAKK